MGKKIFIWFFFVLSLVLTHSLWLFLPAKFLLIRDSIGKADCILPLGGGMYFRFKKAAELYHQGYAQKVLVSVISEEEEKKLNEFYNFDYLIFGLTGVSQKDIAKRALEYFKIQAKDVYFQEGKVTSTFEEAKLAREFMQGKGMSSLILVTDAYHMRRAILNFKWVFRGSGIKIFYANTENPFFQPRFWWQRETDTKLLLTEYVSLAQNIFYHFLLGKTRTDFDD